MKYFIFFALIAHVFMGCYYQSYFFKEKQKDGSLIKIGENNGPGFMYLSINQFYKKHRTYFLIQYCSSEARGVSKDDSERPLKDGEIWLAVTDTSNGYWSFNQQMIDTLGNYWVYGKKIDVKSKSVEFIPLSEKEKNLLDLASKGVSSDSCKYYSLSKVIGFIKHYYPKKNAE